MKKVTYYKKGELVEAEIEEIIIEDDKKLETITNRFNTRTRVIEWKGFNTYYIEDNSALKSSSLDELFEMYKASVMKLPIPQRKCN